MFGDSVDIRTGDTRIPDTLPAAVKGVTHILCCTGTTAFPSARWEFESHPSLSLARCGQFAVISILGLRPATVLSRLMLRELKFGVRCTENPEAICIYFFLRDRT